MFYSLGRYDTQRLVKLHLFCDHEVAFLISGRTQKFAEGRPKRFFKAARNRKTFVEVGGNTSEQSFGDLKKGSSRDQSLIFPAFMVIMKKKEKYSALLERIFFHTFSLDFRHNFFPDFVAKEMFWESNWLF